ncbi:hypothetical protein [Demetria terragena]|uniref:hypothetical protein n=1 Tax=Demetria terragena TaxID=63959 RepID=UPI00036182C3|nr:hypothetical protein [Demetria terragena]
MNHPTPERPSEHSRRTIGRRTLVAGTAWSIPTIAVAAASPATAASPEPTLEFDQPSYTIDGCGDLTDVVITVTNGANPAPVGTPVTITLPAGFTFSDGTDTKTLPTDADGTVAVPAITAPISATAATITATSGEASETATLQVVAPAGGQVLYVGNNGFRPTDFVTTVTEGLPAGESFEFVHASDGAIYAQMSDGKIYTAREAQNNGLTAGNGRQWYETPLTGSLSDMTISSSQISGNSLVMAGGQLTSFVSNTTGTTEPIAQALPNPPGTPVNIATSNGIGTYYVETSDGKLWSTPFSGPQRGTWSEITGFPTPLVDWTITQGNASEMVSVIGQDGNLYSVQSTSGARPTVLRNFRNAFAQWEAPLVKFAAPHESASREFSQSTILFVDASGGLYSQEGAQNRNLAGVLQGQLADKQLLITPDSTGSKATKMVHVVTDGKLYAAGTSVGIFPFRDVTPSADLLQGATIVDVHGTSGGLGQMMFAIASDGRVFKSDRVWSTNTNPNWRLATGLPDQPVADPIVQDAKFTYLLGALTECPV